MREDGSTVEEWRPVVGLDGLYEVSDLGRARSLRPPHGRWREVPRLLTVTRTPSGYPLVRMAGRALYLHRLVLEAFVGPCPDGMECAHNDGNPMNCRIDNLRWSSHRDNIHDRKRHGTDNAGDRHGLSRLTWEQVRELRARPDEDPRLLAREYGINRKHVARIRSGRAWRE